MNSNSTMKNKLTIITTILLVLITACDTVVLDGYRARLSVLNKTKDILFFFEQYDGQPSERFNINQNHVFDEGMRFRLCILDSDLPISYEQLVQKYYDEKPNAKLLFIYYDTKTGQRDTLVKTIFDMEVSIRESTASVNDEIACYYTEYDLLFKGRDDK